MGFKARMDPSSPELCSRLHTMILRVNSEFPVPILHLATVRLPLEWPPSHFRDCWQRQVSRYSIFCTCYILNIIITVKINVTYCSLYCIKDILRTIDNKFGISKYLIVAVDVLDYTVREDMVFTRWKLQRTTEEILPWTWSVYQSGNHSLVCPLAKMSPDEWVKTNYKTMKRIHGCTVKNIQVF